MTIRLSLVIAILLAISNAEAVAPWEIEEIMGSPAPTFELKDLSESKVSLSDFKGKVVLINFWATWCIPCREEMPSLNRLFNRFKKRGFVVLGISINSPKRSVEAFLKEVPVDFHILLDRSSKVSRDYRVFAYPTTFLIDRRGRLRERFIGETDWTAPEVIKVIERYINQ